MSSTALDPLIRLLARLPGLGPRSARRVALHLLSHREERMLPLADMLRDTAAAIRTCTRCGNLDLTDPCGICADPGREDGLLCVVEDVADLWALERAGAFRGRYHVLGGVLSALNGIGPDEINLAALLARVRAQPPAEIILALPATVDGQTTAHYIADRLGQAGPAITRLAHGVPVGGELDYLDDGTLATAMKSRRALGG